ncbi:MAG: phage protease [Verrucomicrobiota bacterium]
MKRFTTAINTAARAINAVSGVFQELTLPEGETTLRYRLSPYGVFPVDDVKGNLIYQVVDRQSAETMAINFGSLTSKLATFFRGIPIYEGHPDDPDWAAANPGHRASAVGRIKSIEPGDDGIYVTSVINSDGKSLLSGDAPKYSGHSPHWRLAPVPGKPDHFTPVLLWSDGLTNTPNILQNTIALNSLQGVEIEIETQSPDAAASADGDGEPNTDETMKLTAEALAALGFAPDATPSPDEISSAIVQLLSAKATSEADKATAEGATTAANSRHTALQTEFDAIRSQAVDTVIGEAIATGRITEADKPAWTTALNTSFVTEANKLKSLMPVLNTASKVPDLGNRREGLCIDAANAASRITEGVRAFAAEKSIDITNEAGWTRAFNECKASKPELFK